MKSVSSIYKIFAFGNTYSGSGVRAWTCMIEYNEIQSQKKTGWKYHRDTEYEVKYTMEQNVIHKKEYIYMTEWNR